MPFQKFYGRQLNTAQVSMVGAGRCGGKKIFKNREGRLNLLNLMNEILLLQKMEKETFEG
jgi:hypothetical protein